MFASGILSLRVFALRVFLPRTPRTPPRRSSSPPASAPTTSRSRSPRSPPRRPLPAPRCSSSTTTRPPPRSARLAERFGARYLPHGRHARAERRPQHRRRQLPRRARGVRRRRRRGPLRLAGGAAGRRPRAPPRAGLHRARSTPAWKAARHARAGARGPPITALDLGPEDTDRVRYAWGANMTVRRCALERVGPFDTALTDAGDEQEWQDRLRAAAGTAASLYVAAAALDHRRTPADARLRPLTRAARARGRASRRFDAWRGEAPTSPRELRTLAGCVGHVVRRRCPAGLMMAAHSLGRLEQARARTWRPAPAVRAPASRRTSSPAKAAPSAASTPCGGRSYDRLADARELLSGRRLRLARAARRSPPRRRVLVLGVERPERRELAAAMRAELERSRHDVELRFGAAGRPREVREPQPAARDQPSRGRGVRLAARGRRRRGAPPRLPRPPCCSSPSASTSSSPSPPTARARTPPGASPAAARAPWRGRRRSSRSAPSPPSPARRSPRCCPSPRCAWAGASTCTGRRSPASTAGAAACSTPSRSATAPPPPADAYSREDARRRGARAARRASLLKAREAQRHPRAPTSALVKVAVVAEFYPRRGDPVLGVWAHRQALAAQAAGAEVHVLVLHRLVPPRASLYRDPSDPRRPAPARRAGARGAGCATG